MRLVSWEVIVQRQFSGICLIRSRVFRPNSLSNIQNIGPSVCNMNLLEETIEVIYVFFQKKDTSNPTSFWSPWDILRLTPLFQRIDILSLLFSAYSENLKNKTSALFSVISELISSAFFWHQCSDLKNSTLINADQRCKTPKHRT